MYAARAIVFKIIYVLNKPEELMPEGTTENEKIPIDNGPSPSERGLGVRLYIKVGVAGPVGSGKTALI